MANFENFAMGFPFAFWLYRSSVDVQNCKILITLSHLALLCLTILILFNNLSITNGLSWCRLFLFAPLQLSCLMCLFLS